ncbi:pilus assembly protein PilP [Ectothiorhodospiraceae bacterium WFHF3C12]|nr:pilus assembly protein PilP [Ectothiorhodospiraceae bacterium WFHF3C12]
MTASTRRNHRAPLIIGLCVTLTLLGCSQEMQDLDKYVANVKSKKPSPIEPIPEMKPFESYQYPGTSELRNPFEPLGFGQAAAQAETGGKDPGEGPEPDPTRAKEALEEFPLDALSYVGTLGQNQSSWALIRDPDGTVHRVSTGNYLGQNYGEIIAITPREIRLRELVREPNGGWLERINSIALRDGQS